MRDGKPQPAYFDLELRPNRSLLPGRFGWLLAGVAAVFGLMGLRFLLLGAWPILPFMLVDLLLLGWAMRASYRSGAAMERVRLDRRGLEVIRVSPTGRVETHRLESWRTRVDLERLPMDQNRLWLVSGQNRIAVGSFLAPFEREEIASVIADGLRRYRASIQ